MGFMLKRLNVLAPLGALLLLATAGSAFAAEGPRPWQMGFRKAATPVMEKITEFHDLLLIICVVITLFVLALLLYVAVKFNEKANPTPSKTTHSTVLEIAWTAIPILVLVVIAVPSFKLLYFADRTHNAELTVKVTGHQWYWSYTYPDNGGFEFDSNIVATEDLKKGQKRLLTVDNEVVIPVNTNVRFLLGSDDVIHNWAVPAFGIKLDTTPGRINETWAKVTREGLFYGMCSELCGVNHGFMPINVRVVSKEAFKIWAVGAKKKFASTEDNKSVRIAEAGGAAK
jgi:cytochrome c oxidase subunit II